MKLIKHIYSKFTVFKVFLLVCFPVLTEAFVIPQEESFIVPSSVVAETSVTIVVRFYDPDSELDSVTFFEQEKNGTAVLIPSATTINSIGDDFVDVSISWSPQKVIVSGDSIPKRYYKISYHAYYSGSQFIENENSNVFTDIEVFSSAPRADYLKVPRYVEMGKTYQFVGRVSDPNGDLKRLRLYSSYSGSSGWKAYGTWETVSGFTDIVHFEWTPSVKGHHSFSIRVQDHQDNEHDHHVGGSIYTIEVLSPGEPAPPVPISLNVPEFATVGMPVYVSSNVSDNNGDLLSIQFKVKAPSAGANEWSDVGSAIPVSGYSDTAGVMWKPPSEIGLYTFRCDIIDSFGNSNVSSNYWKEENINVIILQYAPGPNYPLFPVQGPKIVSEGLEYDVVNEGIIYTSGSVEILGTGSSIFWSGNKITLGPGFKASPTSVNGKTGFFNAVIDSDMDGHSDIKEAQDSDNDGLQDGFEYEIIDFNWADDVSSLEDVSKAGDFDGDGKSNEYEENAGTSPTGLAPGQISPYEGLLVLIRPDPLFDPLVIKASTLLSN